MNVFVTGGSGFVGRRLIRHLRRKGHNVFALARSDLAEQAILRCGGTPRLGDLMERDSLDSAMEGCTACVHAAGHVGMWGRYDDFYKTNVTGTQNVLAAARQNAMKRFVHISAAAVVLNGESVLRADETWPLQYPKDSPYISTKSLAEREVLAANSADMATMAVRPPAIWGPGDASLLPQLRKAVRRHQFVWIDDGTYPCVTAHVDNVCEAAVLALERGRGGQAYFITDGDVLPFRDFVTKLLATKGIKPGELSLPYEFAYRGAEAMELLWRGLHLPGSPPMTRTIVRLIGRPLTVRIDKAQKELGYKPVVDRERGLHELAALR